MTKIPKPFPGEYAPYAAAYINLVPEDGLITAHLAGNRTRMHQLISSLSAEQLNYRYAEGKWNLKEMMVHITDTERVFSYRALCIARGDKSMFPGFEQDDYVLASNASQRTVTSILEEYGAVRESTMHLFNSFDDEAWARTGTANNLPVSVKALAYQTVGHELYHLAIINVRYLRSL